MDVIIKAWKGLGLRCPHCGETSLIYGFLSFREECSHCHYRYLVDEGDFWGQVVISYAFAGIIGITTGATLFAVQWNTWDTRIYTAAIAALAAAILLFPFAKGLWIHFLYLTRGQYADYAPPDKKEQAL